MDRSSRELDVEIASPTLSKTTDLVNVDHQSQQNFLMYVAIVVQGLDECNTLLPVHVSDGDGDGHIWNHVRHQVYQSSITRKSGIWISTLFTKAVVGAGTIVQVHSL